MVRTNNQRTVPIALIAVAALLLAARAGAYLMRANDLVQWVAIDDAVPISQSTGKPILFYFGAGSDRYASEVFASGELAKEINERFVPVRVSEDPQKGQLLMRTFNVRTLPAIVFSDAMGSELARMEGFRGPDEFRRVMDGVR